jgi:hypothetical protein
MAIFGGGKTTSGEGEKQTAQHLEALKEKFSKFFSQLESLSSTDAAETRKSGTHEYELSYNNGTKSMFLSKDKATLIKETVSTLKTSLETFKTDLTEAQKKRKVSVPDISSSKGEQIYLKSEQLANDVPKDIENAEVNTNLNILRTIYRCDGMRELLYSKKPIAYLSTKSKDAKVLGLANSKKAGEVEVELGKIKGNAKGKMPDLIAKIGEYLVAVKNAYDGVSNVEERIGFANTKADLVRTYFRSDLKNDIADFWRVAMASSKSQSSTLINSANALITELGKNPDAGLSKEASEKIDKFIENVKTRKNSKSTVDRILRRFFDKRTKIGNQIAKCRKTAYKKLEGLALTS